MRDFTKSKSFKPGKDGFERKFHSNNGTIHYRIKRRDCTASMLVRAEEMVNPVLRSHVAEKLMKLRRVTRIEATTITKE